MPMTVPMPKSDVERLMREYDAAAGLKLPRRPLEGLVGDVSIDDLIWTARRLIAEGNPGEALRTLRADAERSRNPRFSLVLDELSDSACPFDITPAHLNALDELLGGFPGIDADIHGPRTFRKAAESGQLDIVAHLFSRYGDEARSFTLRPDSKAAELLDVLREKQVLTKALPVAVKAARPRARRL